MTLRRAHRLNAVALGAFIALHLANHAALIAGPEAHVAAMDALRPIYRAGLIEAAILVLFAAQAGIGLALIWRRGRPRGVWAWAQALSGLYLIFFLLQHVPAALMARAAELDTDIRFAGAVVARPPDMLYFAPYYVLAVAAIFTHLACALRFRAWPDPPSPLARALPFAGAAFGALIVAGLMGAFGGYEIEPGYFTHLDATLPW